MRHFFSLVVAAFFFHSICFGSGPLVIVLSKDYGPAYQKWLLNHVPDARLVSLYHTPKDSVQYWLQMAHGYLLTGGEDVYPGRYGQESDTASCGIFDQKRDTLEFEILYQAFRQQKPVFGICRGEQITNIYLGGTLWVDIPASHGNAVRHAATGGTEHQVNVLKNSFLFGLSGVESGKIASNHHQGIKDLGKGLVPMALSPDGIVEAVIYEDQTKIPFLMGVQWHPERMEPGHPLSEPLAKVFIQACKARQAVHK